MSAWDPWAAVDQAVEALAGPDAGDAKPAWALAYEAWLTTPMSGDAAREHAMLSHAEQLMVELASAFRAGYEAAFAHPVAASRPQPEPAAAGGWRLAPVEATQEMVQAALDTEHWAALQVGNPDVRLGFFSAYRAMIAASPSPPGLDEERLREALNRAHGLHLSNGTVTLDFHEDEDAAALWNLLERLNR